MIPGCLVTFTALPSLLEKWEWTPLTPTRCVEPADGDGLLDHVRLSRVGDVVAGQRSDPAEAVANGVRVHEQQPC